MSATKISCCAGVMMIVTIGLAACAGQEAPSTEAFQPEPGSVVEELTVVDRGAPPEPATHEMIAAARSGDPEAMAKVLAPNGVCHHPSTCTPDFASCSSWSATSQCGSDVCNSIGGNCAWDPKGPDRQFYPKLHRSFESYRVCWNISAQPCVEFAETQATTCDHVACCPDCG